MIAIAKEKPANFQRINSERLIGFESIKNIVFPSISLNKSWLQINKTHISPNTSIIESPKSTMIFSSSPSVSFHKAREKAINTIAKNTIT